MTVGDGAVIAASLALIGVLFTVLGGFTYRRLEATLRLHVDVQLQRIQGEVERDLKNHEVRLRIAAEFRLKLLDRMLADVADFRSKLGGAVGCIYLLAQEVEPRGGGTTRAAELLSEAQRAFAALAGAGPYAPQELRQRASDLANDFHAALVDVVEWANIDARDVRAERCRRTSEAMEEVDRRTKKLFGDWQATEFARFTNMLDQLGSGDDAKLSVRQPALLSTR